MKQKIRLYIKCALLAATIFSGFLLWYTFMWFWAGLPNAWWAAGTLGLISGGSAYGLVIWIAKGE